MSLDLETASTLKARILTGGTKDHSQLINRDSPNQHPISAIAGLQAALETLTSGVDGKADGLIFNNETNQLQLTSGGAAIGDPITLPFDISVSDIWDISNAQIDASGNIVFTLTDDENTVLTTYGAGGIHIPLSDYAAGLTIPSDAITVDSAVIQSKLKILQTALQQGIPVFTSAEINEELTLLRLYSVSSAVDGTFDIRYSPIITNKMEYSPLLRITSSITGGEITYETIAGILDDNSANYNDVTDTDVISALNTLIPNEYIGDDSTIANNPNLGTTLAALQIVGLLKRWGLWDNQFYKLFSDMPNRSDESDTEYKGVVRKLIEDGIIRGYSGSAADIDNMVLKLDFNAIRVLTYLSRFGLWDNPYYETFGDLPVGENNTDSEYKKTIRRLISKDIIESLDDTTTTTDETVLKLDQNSIRILTMLDDWGLWGNPYYETYDDLPTGTSENTVYGTEFRDVVHKLIDRNILKGTSSSDTVEETSIKLDYNSIRVLVLLDRLGILDYNFQTTSTPGGIDSSTSASADDGSMYAVGTIVYFGGTKHYTSSNGNTWYTTSPGPARVAYRNPGSKHPYCLEHTDSTSTVEGWVNASDVYANLAAYQAATGS